MSQNSWSMDKLQELDSEHTPVVPLQELSEGRCLSFSIAAGLTTALHCALCNWCGKFRLAHSTVSSEVITTGLNCTNCFALTPF